ncbi:MAG: hypothetical protein P8X74_15905 [Reinekea sp.]
MGAPAIFEKQIEITLLHPASTLKSGIQVISRLHSEPQAEHWLLSLCHKRGRAGRK